MALFLVRAGETGEHEKEFFASHRIYLQWDEVKADLSFARSYDDVQRFMLCMYPEEPPQSNWAGQLFAFTVSMQLGDWVVVPRARHDTMAVGEVVGPYEYVRDAAAHKHTRRVRWLPKFLPKSVLQQDLDSIGASMTVCPISRYDAEQRIRAAAEEAGDNQGLQQPQAIVDTPDLESMAGQSIGAALRDSFGGPQTRPLVEALLKVRRYGIVSVDDTFGTIELFVAAPSAFGDCRSPVCVGVATDERCVDQHALNSLIAVLQKTSFEQGLLVSWGGATAEVEHYIRSSASRVRLWGQQELIREFCRNYAKLDRQTRECVRLKRVWIVDHAR